MSDRQETHGQLTPTSPVQSDVLLAMLARMWLIRTFEQRIARLYRERQIPGFLHTSIGQEAVAVGTCFALDGSDYVATTHRAHGHCLAKGVDPGRMMAELFGKAEGVCSGKGGSMHIADPSLSMLGANAIVGASIPLAAGAALSSKLLGQGRVAVAFFGEGAVNQGLYHEGLNLAAVWELPVIFLCENNLYAEFSDSREMSKRSSTVSTAGGYGVDAAEQVDGNDAEAVYGVVETARERCLADDGPVLIEALTYRWSGHYEGDPQAYKAPDEAALWKSRDPLGIAEDRVKAMGVAGADEIAEIKRAAQSQVESAERFARESPYPDLESIYHYVFRQA